VAVVAVALQHLPAALPVLLVAFLVVVVVERIIQVGYPARAVMALSSFIGGNRKFL
jgi:hypothetical protein